MAEISIPGSDGAWPMRAHRNTFVLARINFSTIFKNQLVASLGYTVNAGTFDMSEHFFTAGITVPAGKKKSASKLSMRTPSSVYTYSRDNPVVPLPTLPGSTTAHRSRTMR